MKKKKNDDRIKDYNAYYKRKTKERKKFKTNGILIYGRICHFLEYTRRHTYYLSDDKKVLVDFHSVSGEGINGTEVTIELLDKNSVL